MLAVFCCVKITTKLVASKNKYLLSNSFFGWGIWEGPSTGVLGQNPSWGWNHEGLLGTIGCTPKLAHSYNGW